MKNKLHCLLALMLFSAAAKAQIGIGTNAPNSTAVLDLSSNSKGVLFPRMNAAARIGISAPATGLVVFDTDSSSLFIYSTGWKKLMPVNSLNSLVTGTSAGDVLVWNGSTWVATPKCNLFTYLFRDKDGDGKGDHFTPLMSCGTFPGYVADSSDCDDNDAAVGALKWFRDFDVDGYGDVTQYVTGCYQVAGYVADSTDCNDNNAAINPGAGDLPDDSFGDSNCDGIDGSAVDAIFVATTGNDANPGTRAAPMKTINAGIAKASANSKTQVLVSKGKYSETVTMQAGISLYGGYDAGSNWTRAASNRDTINGQTGGMGVIMSSITISTTLDRFVIVSPNAAVAGSSSYGIYATGSAKLTIKNNMITPGNGAVGSPGGTGAGGPSGNNGSFGSGGACDASVTATGGNGGTSSCSQAGGKGGNGGYSNVTPATAGSASVGGSIGGNAGNFGDPGSSGSAGNNGAAGVAGVGGSGGSSPSGSIAAQLWAGAGGNNGATGGDGKGGGGGGGGGGQFCTFCTNGTGNGGGGGGSGGCGGGAGGGGVAGGGSFGIFLVSAGTGNVIANNTITNGNGGAGGPGGGSGTGGAPGAGSSGTLICTAEVGAGGKGGNGGVGGNGGGGGGGAGGASVGIVTNGAAVTNTGNSITTGLGGSGGPGGSGGAGGNNGTSGVSGTSGTSLVL